MLDLRVTWEVDVMEWVEDGLGGHYKNTGRKIPHEGTVVAFLNDQSGVACAVVLELDHFDLVPIEDLVVATRPITNLATVRSAEGKNK